MSSAWSQLDQLLTCAICLDRYRNPKLLPCQHTFCVEPCLDGLIDYARRQIKCPECRAEHRIPYKGIQEFPTNVTLMRFLELHRDITGEEPEPPPSMMERCSVCSEKANLEKCAHCDKKICPDCKEAHVDILRREINRINNQVRRGLHRLSDALAQTKKNADKLRVNCVQVRDEIEDIVRRYSKDLKHTEDKLKHDLEIYTENELKAINKLKDDLESEVSNMNSNCDLVEKYIKDDTEWSDAELLEYKDIFLKTLDFLRSFDADSSDFSRRIRFQSRADPDILHRNIADFGELKVIAPPSAISTIHQPPMVQPPSNALMRSQSDHRLAAQFARRTESRFGGHTSDNERDSGRPTSPLYGRNRRENESSGYRRYSERNRENYEYDRPSNRYSRDDNSSSTILSSRWRDGEEYGHRPPRYNRDCDDYDSEPQNTGRTVRFADEPQQRERIFEADVGTKGPLSGIVRLMDSPRVMERLHQNEVRQKQQTSEKDSPTTPPVQQQNILETRPIPPQRRTPVRQQSEDDVERQKKAAQQAGTSTPTSQPSSEAPQRPVSRRDTTEVPQPITAGRTTRIESPPPRESSPIIESHETTSSRKLPPIPTETAEESDSSSTNTTNSRFNRSTLGKTLTSNCGGESTPNKKVSITNQTTASLSDRHSRIEEDVPRPVQSSFFTRQRRLPDPEPRLLESQDSDDEDDEEDEEDQNKSETEDEDDEEEEEEEEESESEDDDELDEGPLKQASNTTPNILNTPSPKPKVEDEIESESEESESESSSTESENEETDEKDDSNQHGEVQNSPASKRYDINDCISNTQSRYHAPRNNKDVINDNECKGDLPVNHSCYGESATLTGDDRKQENDNKSIGRRRSDDYDTTDSSSASSSTNYQSLSNTPTALSNSTADENSEARNYSKKESRFAKRHPTLSRSRSSHELGLGYDTSENQDIEDDDTEVSNSPPCHHRTKTEDTNPTRSRPKLEHQMSLDSPLSSANTSWANYLKNKYGSNPTSRVIPRSRSSHSLYQRSDSETSEDDVTSGRDRLSGSMGFSNPRSTYMQKRRMLYKFGSRGSEPGNFTWPRGIAVGPDDSIVVADSSNHRVQVFDSLGMFLFEFGSYGSCEGQFDCLSGVAVNRIGQYIVSDRYNQRVQLFDPAGRFLRTFGSEGRTDGRFNCPWGITTDSLGFIYVCDKENHRVQVFQSDGSFVGKFGTMGSRPGQLENPHYIAVSNTNRVVVSDSNNHRIQIFDVNGRTLSTFGSEGSAEGQFKYPRGVAVDDQGYIVVGDSGNNRIQIFHPDGTYLRGFGIWGSADGEFKGLEGIAVTSAGNILVCDRENHRIQVF